MAKDNWTVQVEDKHSGHSSFTKAMAELKRRLYGSKKIIGSADGKKFTVKKEDDERQNC